MIGQKNLSWCCCWIRDKHPGSATLKRAPFYFMVQCRRPCSTWRSATWPGSTTGPTFSPSSQVSRIFSIVFCHLSYWIFKVLFKNVLCVLWNSSVLRIRDVYPETEFFHPRSRVNAKVTTVLGSIPASSDTGESEGRQMKQCWITYFNKNKNPKKCPFLEVFVWPGNYCELQRFEAFSSGGKVPPESVVYVLLGALDVQNVIF